MLPTVVLVDTCAAFDTLKTDAASLFLPETDSGPMLLSDIVGNGTIDPLLDGDLQSFVDYYLVCEGVEKPNIIKNLPSYAEKTVTSFVNISSIIDTVESSSGMRLVPKIRGLFDELGDKVVDGLVVVDDLVEYLDCKRFLPIFEDMHDIECVTLKHGLVLYTWGITMMAIFMCAGICIGICGFKRLQRQVCPVA